MTESQTDIEVLDVTTSGSIKLAKHKAQQKGRFKDKEQKEISAQSVSQYLKDVYFLDKEDAEIPVKGEMISEVLSIRNQLRALQSEPCTVVENGLETETSVVTVEQNDFGERVVIVNDVQKLKEIVKESKIWKERQRIISERLSVQDAKKLISLNKLLSQDQEKFQVILDGLIDFQKARMKHMGVSELEVSQGIAHIKSGVELCEKKRKEGKGKGSPITTLVSAIHDIEKYSNQGMILTEHGLVSSMVGSEVLAKALQAVDLSNYSEPIKKFSAKASMVHDSGEFPEIQAMRSPVGDPIQSNQEKLGDPSMNLTSDDPEEDHSENVMYLLSFYDGDMQLYIQTPREKHIQIWEENVYSHSEINENDLAELTQVPQNVSEADKIVGMESFEKYVAEASPAMMYGKNTIIDYVNSFAPTLVLNHELAPNTLGLKNGNLARFLQRKAELLMQLLVDTEDEHDIIYYDEAENKNKIDWKKFDDSKLEPYFHLGSKEGNYHEPQVLYMQAYNLKVTFDKGKEYYQQTYLTEKERIKTLPSEEMKQIQVKLNQKLASYKNQFANQFRNLMLGINTSLENIYLPLDPYGLASSDLSEQMKIRGIEFEDYTLSRFPDAADVMLPRHLRDKKQKHSTNIYTPLLI